MNTSIKYLFIITAAFSIAACSTLTPKDESGDVSVEDQSSQSTDTTDEGSDSAVTRGMQNAGAFKGDPLDNPDSPLSTRVIYFDFDSSDIHSEDKPVVEAHADYLAEHSGASVTLEGHTDERGTREYNLALGERRSKSVARIMRLLGVSDNQIRIVSFGEERPAVMGHVDSAWDLNRRVEIIYRTK